MNDDSFYIVTPETLYFNAMSGQTIKNVIQVENKGQKTIELSVKGVGVKVLDQHGHIRRNNGSETSLGTWIKVETPVISIAPGKKEFVPLRITVPSNVEPGSYSGALDFISREDIVQIEKGTVVHVDVGKTAKTNVSLLDLKQKLNGNDFFSQLIQLQLRNSGDALAQPAGNLLIQSWSGQTITSIPIKEVLIMPQSNWNTIYKLPVSIPGIYRVELKLQYDRGQRNIVGDTYLISPLLLFLMCAGSVLAIIGLFIYHKKKWKRRKK